MAIVRLSGSRAVNSTRPWCPGLCAPFTVAHELCHVRKDLRVWLASALACVAGVTGGDLKRRIEAIISNRAEHRLNYAKKAILAVAATAAVVTPIVVGITNTPAVRVQSSPPAPSAVTPRFEVASIK